MRQTFFSCFCLSPVSLFHVVHPLLFKSPMDSAWCPRQFCGLWDDLSVENCFTGWREKMCNCRFVALEGPDFSSTAFLVWRIPSLLRIDLMEPNFSTWSPQELSNGPSGLVLHAGNVCTQLSFLYRISLSFSFLGNETCSDSCRRMSPQVCVLNEAVVAGVDRSGGMYVCHRREGQCFRLPSPPMIMVLFVFLSLRFLLLGGDGVVDPQECFCTTGSACVKILKVWGCVCCMLRSCNRHSGILIFPFPILQGSLVNRALFLHDLRSNSPNGCSLC